MNKNRMYPTWFVFGALLLYGVLYVLPSLMGIGLSFTDWSVYSQEIRFAGLKNIQTVFSSDYNYTHALLNSVFDVYCKQSDEIKLLEGEPPSPLQVQPGCPFALRCPRCQDRCRSELPELREVGEGHLCACFHPLEDRVVF